MATIDQIGEADGWRCWLCDQPVDPDRSVNDDRGPSIDSRMTKRKAKAKKKAPPVERLAHRSCNTGKGGTDPVIPWGEELFVIDPVPIIAAVERLHGKGGREIMCRCPSEGDADVALAWITDRLSRLEPGLNVEGSIEPGGGQYLIALRA